MINNQSLYPDILFHFTTKDGLYGILNDTFSVSYVKEKIVGIRKSTEFAVPMVSFCDLRLSELKSHMDKYGCYGIGLTKEWANRNGLNPVFYVNRHSPFTGEYIKAVEGLYRQLNLDKKNSPKVVAEDDYMKILKSYSYIKNYEADLKRRTGRVTKNYRYADEREWRYIPPPGSIIYPFLPAGSLATPEQKERCNSSVKHLKLRFNPEDVKYLIIKSDDEIAELISHLEKVKRRFNVKIRRRLASRILTSEQIMSDV